MSRGEDASPTLCADPLCRQFCVGGSEPSRTDRPGLSAPPPARRWGVTSQRGPAGTGDQRRVHREHGRQGYGLRHAAQRPGARLEVRSASNVGSAFDCPDPFVLRARSIYLGFAREEPPSGGSSSRPVFATNSALGTIQVIHSPDAHTWLPLGDALPSLPAWATPPVPRPVGPCTDAAAPVLRSHDDLAGPVGRSCSRMPQARKMMAIHAYQPPGGRIPQPAATSPT